MSEGEWIDVGAAEDFKRQPLRALLELLGRETSRRQTFSSHRLVKAWFRRPRAKTRLPPRGSDA